MTASETRPVRGCVLCGQSDTHPRHVISVGGSYVLWHLDCHANATQCVTCTDQLADAGGATGDRLLKHIQSLPARVIVHDEKVN